jgi:hypothetical protein
MKQTDIPCYILQDRDGDYVKHVEGYLSETVHSHFIFTKDKAEAKLFSYNDLWSPLNTHGTGEEFVRGFSGGKAIKV